MKKCLAFILCIILCSVLTGCWNYREIESLAVAAGVGIDRDSQSGEYIIYVEFIQPSETKEQTPVSTVVESRGKTIFDAIRGSIATSGKRIFWSHAQIIVVSEDVARQGILDVLDFFYRGQEQRLTLYLLVVQDASAKDIFDSKGITNQILSYEISDTVRYVDSIEKFPKVELYKIIETMKSEVPYAYAPSITVKKQQDKEVTQVFGTAIFKGDNLQGFLGQEDTKYFLYVIDEIKGGLLVNNDAHDSPNSNISLEVFNSKTTVKPIYNDGKITMEIKIKTETAIAEVGPDININDIAGLTALQEDMQKFLQQNIKRVIQKVQSEFGTDIFGFGQIIYQHLPDVWKQYKNNWESEFNNLEFNITSEIDFRNTAQASKSFEGVY